MSAFVGLTEKPMKSDKLSNKNDDRFIGLQPGLAGT